jgi:hypothetical protein
MAEIGGTERALELAIFGPEGVEHQLAVGAVGCVAVEGVGLVVEADLLAGRQGDGRPGNVRGDELLADIARSREGRGSAGEQVLAFRRQSVLRLADDVGEIEIEARFERGVGGEEPVDLRLPHCQQFGRDP